MDTIFINENINNKKEYNLKIRLNYKNFLFFLSFLSNKLYFESLSSFIKHLSDSKNNVKKCKYNIKDMNINYIHKLYNELTSDELVNIIQEFTPIINLYFIFYARKYNLNEISFNIFIKILSEFEIFPQIVNYNIIKNIFCVLYEIKYSPKEEINVTEENVENNLEQKNREIGFNEIMISFGIISLYLKDISNINEIQALLSLFYLIINSEKIKPFLKEMNFNFIEILKEKIYEISKNYNGFKIDDEPDFIKFLKDPYL